MGTFEDELVEKIARNTERRNQTRIDRQRQAAADELARLHSEIMKTLKYLDTAEGPAGPSPYATGDYAVDQEKHPEIRWGIYADDEERFIFWEFLPGNVVVGYDKSAHERPIHSWQGSYVLLRDGRVGFVMSKHFGSETRDVLFYDVPDSPTKLEAGPGVVKWEATPSWGKPHYRHSRIHQAIDAPCIDTVVQGLEELRVKAELWGEIGE